MRKHILNIRHLIDKDLILKTPLSDLVEEKKWLEDVKDNIANILAITREQERLEEEMFLQAATECEKDFYYLKEDIETLEERDGEPMAEFTIVGLPAIGVNGWENDF
jgi:hypothetical protein